MRTCAHVKVAYILCGKYGKRSKGRRSRLADIFFKNYFCHVCHTRFAIFFAPPSFYVSSLLRAFTTLTIQGRWNCDARGKLSVQPHVSPFVNGYRTPELFVCLNDRGTVEFKQIYKRVNIHLKERSGQDINKGWTKRIRFLVECTRFRPLSFSFLINNWWPQDYYRQIFVYTFCLINLCLSLSDDANKIKTLTIERSKQFQLSLKIWAQYTEWFQRNSLPKTRHFTENVWLINIFATQQFRSFRWLIFPSILLAKSWKLHILLNLIISFNFCI